jgi:hypothetical protein
LPPRFGALHPGASPRGFRYWTFSIRLGTLALTPLIVIETVTAMFEGAGVPGFPPPPPPPPPQPTPTMSITKIVKISAKPHRRCFPRQPSATNSAQNTHTRPRALFVAVRQPEISGRLRKRGATEEGAVVWKMSIAVAVPFVARVIEPPELHVVSEGNPVHTGVIVAGPLLLNPLMAVKVSVVEPDAPGLLTGTVVGTAVTVNPGAVDCTVMGMPDEA